MSSELPDYDWSDTSPRSTSPRSREGKLITNLTQILRHSAPRLDLEIFQGGFIDLQDVLKRLSVFRYTVREVEKCVESIRDQRFEIKTDQKTEAILIRVKSGHSFPVDMDKAESVPSTTSTAEGNRKNAKNKSFDHFDDGEWNNHVTDVEARLKKAMTTIKARMDHATNKRLETRLEEVEDKVTVQNPAKQYERVKPELNDVRRTVYWILKYGTEKNGLQEREDGFVDVEALLQVNNRILCSSIIADIIALCRALKFFQLGKLNSSGDMVVLDRENLDVDIDIKSDHVYIRLCPDEKNRVGRPFVNPVVNKLLNILQYDAPNLGLTIGKWGFINIRKILNLRLKEFEGLTEADLLKHVNSFLNSGEVKKDSLIIRRDPDNTQEIQIRATRGHRFPVPNEAEFDHKTEANSRLSKTLSFFLRHHAPKEVRDPFGYVTLEWLFQQHNFKRYTPEQVVELVEAAEGIERFHLLVNKYNNQLEIRANYGHTFEVCSVELEQILLSDDFPNIIYGTNFAGWEEIKQNGIPRTTLVHIHLATGEEDLKRCRFVYYSEYQLLDIMIYIDLAKALEDGIKFFLTFNGVVLCRREGEIEQYLDPKYFNRAVNIATGEDMSLDGTEEPQNINCCD